MDHGPTFETLATGYNSPEGPAVAANGDLYFVNWLTSAVVRIAADGVPREVAHTGGIPAGLAFHRDGTLYCADEGERIHGVIRIDASRPSSITLPGSHSSVAPSIAETTGGGSGGRNGREPMPTSPAHQCAGPGHARQGTAVPTPVSATVSTAA